MLRLVADDLRSSLRRPQILLVALFVIAFPPVYGVLSLPGYAFDHWVSYFTVMFDWVAVLYPLLVGLLIQPRLLDEWSNTYAWSTRTRASAAVYFGSKAIASALLSFVVFLVMTVVSFTVARLTFTDHGYDVPLVGPVESRFDFSQLWTISPVLYAAVYSLWVALVSATVAVGATVITALIVNKFVALAVPFVVWFIVTFGMAVLGLEEFSLPPFRFHISQQPIWTDVVSWLAIVALTAAFYAYIHDRDYETPGIVRT